MAETLHAKLHEGEKENNQRRKMSGIDLIFMAVFCLVLGYAIRDGIQISRDFNEAMRNLEAAHLAHEKAMRWWKNGKRRDRQTSGANSARNAGVFTVPAGAPPRYRLA